MTFDQEYSHTGNVIRPRSTCRGSSQKHSLLLLLYLPFVSSVQLPDGSTRTRHQVAVSLTARRETMVKDQKPEINHRPFLAVLRGLSSSAEEYQEPDPVIVLASDLVGKGN